MRALNFRILAVCVAAVCAGCQANSTTDELLAASGLNADLSAGTESFSVQAGAQKELILKGGRSPYTATILGSGTATVSGTKLQYTAGELVGRDIITISDTSGKKISISANITDQGKEPSKISGNTLWLKADAISLANGATLSTWSDSSGNSRNFGIGSPKPTFATNSLNGYPVVTFSGSQYIERAYDAAMNTNSFTWFVLYSTTAYPTASPPNSYATLFASSGGTTGSSFFVRNSTTPSSQANEFQYGTGLMNERVTPVNTVSLQTWYVGEAIMDDVAKLVTLRQDGVLISQISRLFISYSLNSSQSNFVGASGAASNFFTGKIAEVIVFNRALTAVELQAVRCYLKNKYALSYSCG